MGGVPLVWEVSELKTSRVTVFSAFAFNRLRKDPSSEVNWTPLTATMKSTLGWSPTSRAGERS